MPETLAQSTSPSTGASNAADFQPETRNPQTAPSQLFSQPQGVQSGSQADLLSNSKATIQVPSNPASEAPAAPTVAFNWTPWLLLAAVLLVALAVWRVLRRPAPATRIPEPVEVAVPEELVIERPVPATPKQSTAKKPVPKKSKSKRKKRARR